MSDYKRILSAVLTVALVLVMLPVGMVQAAEIQFEERLIFCQPFFTFGVII